MKPMKLTLFVLLTMSAGKKTLAQMNTSTAVNVPVIKKENVLIKTATEKIMQKASKLNLQNPTPLVGIETGFYMIFLKQKNNYGSEKKYVYIKNNAPEAYGMWGDIYDKATNNIGVPLEIGYPITDEFITPKKAGAGQHFENGSIYWSDATKAHEVHGSIRDKYKSLGWENSFLGFPTTDETKTPDGFGRFNFFEGGAIYYHPNLGTYAVNSMIANVWKKEGWEKGKLGYPTSDEIIQNNNSIQLFEFGAIISVKAGPYKVIYNGLGYRKDGKFPEGLYSKWLQTGGANSYLGDLVTPNKNYPKLFRYYFAEFAKGFIYENPNKTKAFVIKKGPLFDYYASKKWESGSLGFPTSDERTEGTFIVQDFEGGKIFYSAETGAFEKK